MPRLLTQFPVLSGPVHILKKPHEYELVINKSRFIAYLSPVRDVATAEEIIKNRRLLHPNARHHCTALALGTPIELQRSNDDGEPAGTAGMPIANALRAQYMSDTVAIVTRYFGGIKLGAAGLSRAYGSATAEALHTALAAGLIGKRIVVEIVEAAFDYLQAGAIEALIRNWAKHSNAQILQVEYATPKVKIQLALLPGALADLETALGPSFAGQIELTSLGWQFQDQSLNSN